MLCDDETTLGEGKKREVKALVGKGLNVAILIRSSRRFLTYCFICFNKTPRYNTNLFSRNGCTSGCARLMAV